MANINPETGQLLVIPDLCVSDIIDAALRTMSTYDDVSHDMETQLTMVPLMREVLSEMNNNYYILPSYRYERLIAITDDKSIFTWGIGGEIDKPYPIKLDQLFLAPDGLTTTTAEGIYSGSNAFANASIYYIYPGDRNAFVGNRFVANYGIPTTYWLETTRPLHTLYLDGVTTDDSNVLYCVAKFAMLLPQDDTEAYNYPLTNLEEGHREYMRLSLCIKMASRYGIFGEQQTWWRNDLRRVKQDITQRQYKPQIVASETANIFHKNNYRGRADRGYQRLVRGYF